jgi:hypothetical protein
LFCLLTLLLSSRRYANTGVLSPAPLKCLTQSARVVPSEPRPQPSCAEPLPAQVEEGLAMATTVEESGTLPPPPMTAAAIGEGRTVVETATPKRHWSHQPGWPGRCGHGDGTLG